MKKNSDINILIAPLNWGIGHASRCVPLIECFLRNNFNVIIASDGRSSEFLKKEFPHLRHIELNSYNIQYTKDGKNLVFKIIIQIPKILYAVYKEHQLTKKIIKNNAIDIIISDNRYGVFNKNVYSVLITHQLCIKMPTKLQLFENFGHYLLRKKFNKFDELWIPDFESEINLSGALSHKYIAHINQHFIGPLSRFNKYEKSIDTEEKENDILVLLSGPEPQRSIFEEIIINELKNSTYKTIILRGATEKNESYKINNNITVYSHLSSFEIASLINNSKITISRTGYTSIMDLYVLKAQAILIPTPGQTEQNYLAELIKRNRLFHVVSQDDLKINVISKFLNTKLKRDFFAHIDDKIINERIENFIHIKKK